MSSFKWLIFPLVIGFLAVGLIAYGSKIHIPRKMRPTTFLYPPKQLKYFTLGYDEVVADTLWIRVIQDFDTCEQSNAELWVPTLPPALLKDGGNSVRPPSRCNNSWVYQMTDLITELAPKFRSPYEHGATLLSILVDDREGALKIYEKGVERFPGDWNLHYRLGYHYLYEIHDIAKAAEQLKLAADSGAPGWAYALAGRLYTKSGQVELGISVLEGALAKENDPEYVGALEKRLAELKKELGKAQIEERTKQ